MIPGKDLKKKKDKVKKKEIIGKDLKENPALTAEGETRYIKLTQSHWDGT